MFTLCLSATISRDTMFNYLLLTVTLSVLLFGNGSCASLISEICISNYTGDLGDLTDIGSFTSSVQIFSGPQTTLDFDASCGSLDQDTPPQIYRFNLTSTRRVTTTAYAVEDPLSNNVVIQISDCTSGRNKACAMSGSLTELLGPGMYIISVTRKIPGTPSSYILSLQSFGCEGNEDLGDITDKRLIVSADGSFYRSPIFSTTDASVMDNLTCGSGVDAVHFIKFNLSKKQRYQIATQISTPLEIYSCATNQVIGCEATPKILATLEAGSYLAKVGTLGADTNYNFFFYPLGFENNLDSCESYCSVNHAACCSNYDNDMYECNTSECIRYNKCRNATIASTKECFAPNDICKSDDQGYAVEFNFTQTGGTYKCSRCGIEGYILPQTGRKITYDVQSEEFYVNVVLFVGVFVGLFTVLIVLSGLILSRIFGAWNKAFAYIAMDYRKPMKMWDSFLLENHPLGLLLCSGDTRNFRKLFDSWSRSITGLLAPLVLSTVMAAVYLQNKIEYTCSSSTDASETYGIVSTEYSNETFYYSIYTVLLATYMTFVLSVVSSVGKLGSLRLKIICEVVKLAIVIALLIIAELMLMGIPASSAHVLQITMLMIFGQALLFDYIVFAWIYNLMWFTLCMPEYNEATVDPDIVVANLADDAESQQSGGEELPVADVIYIRN